MKPKSWWNSCIDLRGVAHARWEIAENLKGNWKAFGGLSAAEREVMRECEVEELCFGLTWSLRRPEMSPISDYDNQTYRVRPSFQPEYAEEPVKVCGAKSPSGLYVCTLAHGHEYNHFDGRFTWLKEQPAPIPFDPTYAPPGFVAVEGGECGEKCAMHNSGKCNYYGKYCQSDKRPDGIGANLKRKPAPAWGEWMEYQTSGLVEGRIRFRKVAGEVQGE
jgi:hypothetical protein